MSHAYALRRLLQVLPAVAGIVVVTFVVVHLAPGDPVVALAGQSGDEAYYQFMRAKFGLDRPLPAQFLTYAGNLLTGDLGVSFVQGRPVSAVIGDRLPATLLLTLRPSSSPASQGSSSGRWPPAGRSGRWTWPSTGPPWWGTPRPRSGWPSWPC